MSAKDNFNQAMSDMFGVGKEKTQQEPVPNEEKASPAAAQAAPYVNRSAAPATYLAEGTVIEGTLRSKGDVEIVGEMRGDIDAQGKVTLHTDVKGNVTAGNLNIPSCNLVGDVHCSGKVTIGLTAVIQGNIYAQDVLVSGKVIGDIDASEHISMEESSTVNGNIKTATMSMSRGARLHGGIEMREDRPRKVSVYGVSAENGQEQ